MFPTLEFVFVACLFANLVVVRGAQVWTWLKGAEATVVTDVSNVATDVKNDVSKLVADVKKDV